MCFLSSHFVLFILSNKLPQFVLTRYNRSRYNRSIMSDLNTPYLLYIYLIPGGVFVGLLVFFLLRTEKACWFLVETVLGIKKLNRKEDFTQNRPEAFEIREEMRGHPLTSSP